MQVLGYSSQAHRTRIGGRGKKCCWKVIGGATWQRIGLQRAREGPRELIAFVSPCGDRGGNQLKLAITDQDDRYHGSIGLEYGGGWGIITGAYCTLQSIQHQQIFRVG